MTVRVRFAPSPTGYLHIGGARTALFNWLYARKTGGRFILRVEDTDEARSREAMVVGILEGLRWLGLDWDEGPHFQSRRKKQHQEVVDRLIRSGDAYRDFSPMDAPSAAHLEFRNLPAEESDRRADAGEPFAIRFRVPKGKKIEFEDVVFGSVQVDSDEVEDFVIQRTDGMPTYHLSVVADDVDMEITHVIRGADHLSNTPKHILLYDALERERPCFAHLPLILGTDKKRLSKRHGAASVTEYARQGLLPEAVRNYLALLGWSPGDDSELLGREELIQKFDLDRINKANAVFDPSKLEFINKKYISSASAEDLADEVDRALVEAGLRTAPHGEGERSRFLSTIELLKGRVQDLDDFAAYGRPFFTDQYEYEEAALERYVEKGPEALPAALEELKSAYSNLESFDLESTEGALRAVAERHDLKAGQLIGAVRVATTGRGQAPGIFDVLVTLGRERTLDRLQRLISFLQENG